MSPHRLFAVSDLHLGHAANREAIEAIRPRPDDWLILAGDVAERDEHIRLAFEHFGQKFRQLVWVPGNHELWTRPGRDAVRGEARYAHLVELCRSYGVLTPEDDYPILNLIGGPVRLVPMFLLYDYSFRPDHVALDDAVAWARESGVVCTDELLLSPKPHDSRSAWCHARVEATRARLEALDEDLPTILVNHWPLRHEFAVPPRIPRFSLWCGTVKTADWHWRYRAKAVVSGHLHMPSTRLLDDTRFEEVSFGYPKQWQGRRHDPDTALREIMAA
ncbi:MAG: metallophosphoesterase [Fulvimarina manganoxydans]|uniref:metallophosphoesterase family protein n=1 Tax=Fulvimarina manganoxydans TaxID=937218 RepID=UPI002352DB50|nr:metallophosphoesterase [Fulvimarina manganoxydans]MCK5931074.1 metallophosphoesterase [Fulvimarina manganoxydans]